MKHPIKKKCKLCGDMAILMDIDNFKPYYFHYSFSDCSNRERLKPNDKTLTKWTKDDEIRNLKKVLQMERDKYSLYKERMREAINKFPTERIFFKDDEYGKIDFEVIQKEKVLRLLQ